DHFHREAHVRAVWRVHDTAVVAKLREVHIDVLVLLAVGDLQRRFGRVPDRIGVAVPGQQQFAIGALDAQLQRRGIAGGGRGSLGVVAQVTGEDEQRHKQCDGRGRGQDELQSLAAALRFGGLLGGLLGSLRGDLLGRFFGRLFRRLHGGLCGRGSCSSLFRSFLRGLGRRRRGGLLNWLHRSSRGRSGSSRLRGLHLLRILIELVLVGGGCFLFHLWRLGRDHRRSRYRRGRWFRRRDVAARCD